MSKKQKDFFKSSDLKLNREIKEARSKHAKEKSKGGFIKELENQAKMRLQYKEAKAEYDKAGYYKGESVSPSQSVVSDTDFSQDPSKVGKDPEDKGFSNQINWQLDRKGVK